MHHPYGCHLIGNRYYFTIYAPHAGRVRLAFYKQCDDKQALRTVPMRKVDRTTWEFSDINNMEGLYYAYLIDNDNFPVCDPYARFVATRCDYQQEAKAFICNDKFDWGNGHFLNPANPRDLVIYECHVKDMTAFSKNDYGSYNTLREKLPYLKSLGINALELLPIMKFAKFEPPYKEEIGHIYNNWNPYSANYWGYMTSYFFAPENSYASHADSVKDRWLDTKAREGRELKELVKACHQENISVIMDVVYNHVSHYDKNPLKILAENDYLQFGKNDSGCGNDINSNHPVTRQLILDSLSYWMNEYHIDGFRFDLTGILDDDTLNAVRETCSRINPNVVLYGEPWGRRYFPHRMSELGFGSWNDRFRNGIKGENPINRKGFIFGEWDHEVNPQKIVSFMTGTLLRHGGLFRNSAHSVNYLESHDGYTLSDFIRIALGHSADKKVTDRNNFPVLNKNQLTISRLAAFILFFSRGMIMIQAGQEFGRTKIIADCEAAGDNAGLLDHNSYQKDDKTNYIDFSLAKRNSQLTDYYRSCIRLRSSLHEIRSDNEDNILHYYSDSTPFGVGYGIESSRRHLAVLVNTDPGKGAEFSLKISKWILAADEKSADIKGIGEINDNIIKLKPQSAALLFKEK